MELGLQGRVALVTGASRGIGRAIAEGLAAEGARVAVASRSQDELETLATAIGGCAHRFDSTDLDAVDGLIDAVEAALGPIDVYVANTGGPPVAADPLAHPRTDWEAANRSLVLSPMAILQRVLPGMCARGFGRIVAVSSSAAREPLPGLQLSNAYRPALLNAFKHLAREVAADGVTLNAVLPAASRPTGSPPTRAGWAPRRTAPRARSRPGGWEPRRSWRPPPCSCARPRRATSPGSRSSSTGA